MGKELRGALQQLKQYMKRVKRELSEWLASPLLPIALLTYILLSGSVMYYDLKVFQAWSSAVDKIGILKLYLAPETLGYTYRAVYPPLSPIVFLLSYRVASEVARELAMALGSPSGYGFLFSLITGFASRLLLKIPLIGVALGLWRLMVKEYGRKISLAILLGPPVLTVIAVYNFDLFMVFFLVLGMLEAYREHYTRSAILVVIASLFKQPAIVVLPLLLVYVYRVRGGREAARVLFLSALIGLAVVAPFAIGSGEAFFKWIAGFHGKRPPQGPTLFTVIYTTSGYRFEDIASILSISTLSILVLVLLAFIALVVEKRLDYSKLLYSATASIIGVLALSKVVNPVYTLWAYPFIVGISVSRRTLKPLALYLLASLAVYLWVILLFFSALVLGKPVYLHEEMRWLQPSELQAMIYSSLGPYSAILDLFILIGRSSSVVWGLSVAIYSNWWLVELVLASIYTSSMLLLYFWLLSHLSITRCFGRRGLKLFLKQLLGLFGVKRGLLSKSV